MGRGQRGNYSNLLRSLGEQRTSGNFRWPNNGISNVKRPEDGLNVDAWAIDHSNRARRVFSISILPLHRRQVVAQMHTGRST